jgi:hypothetical protein
MTFSILILVLIFQIVLTGCVSELEQEARICPGADSAEQLFSTLQQRRQAAVSIKASGQCKMLYYEQGKKHRENFPVKIWMEPPSNIYLQGDVAFDPKGVVAGSNSDEFWLAIRLKEVSSYWWGSWSEQKNVEGLVINPVLLLEALGVIEFEDDTDWSFSKEGPFDILEKGKDGVIIEKICLGRCDSLIRKILNIDAENRTEVTIKLDKYRQVEGDFAVPFLVRIEGFDKENEQEFVEIRLSSVRQVSFSDRQRQVIFSRPRPEGFKRVYLIEQETLTEQSGQD